MIVRDKPSIWMLFFITKGSVITDIWAKILIVTAFSIGIYFLDSQYDIVPHFSLSAMGVFGIAMSLFLSFRNSAAYDRWWEARKLWGALVGDSRSFARDTRLFLKDNKHRKRLLYLLAAFTNAHRMNLRFEMQSADLKYWLQKEEVAAVKSSSAPACYALNLLAEEIAILREKEILSELGTRVLSERMGMIAMSQAGCERIANTPLPFVYSLLIRRTAYLYCFLVPFALIDAAGYMAPLFSAIIAYVFFGLAAVTNHLEHPFYRGPNGLPLDAMCRTIENGLLCSLGKKLRPAIKPQGFLLE
ncbi:bestrophin family protein [Curvivirga sp.]|uniref:bestrophin family protein n=1 Tax=Curvivirga sp. TaxID=2856848 RepID=UPI003B5ADAA0